MTDNINEYDELIMKYEELFHSTHHPSSTEYKQKLAELEQLADPNVLLKKTIIDKLVELPCYKLEEYLSFFGGQAQTGDILKLPEPSTRKCRYGDKCYRQGNLQHMAEFTHPSTVPRHHIHLLFEKLHEILKSKSDDKCGASKRRKRKNTKKRKNFRKKSKVRKQYSKKKRKSRNYRKGRTKRGGNTKSLRRWYGSGGAAARSTPNFNIGDSVTTSPHDFSLGRELKMYGEGVVVVNVGQNGYIVRLLSGEVLTVKSKFLTNEEGKMPPIPGVVFQKNETVWIYFFEPLPKQIINGKIIDIKFDDYREIWTYKLDTANSKMIPQDYLKLV